VLRGRLGRRRLGNGRLGNRRSLNLNQQLSL
jgi:hypothetical protein